MRRGWLTCLLLLLPLTGGCTVFRQIDDNVVYEKRLYCSAKKHYKDIRHDADAVLKEIAVRHPKRVFSHDFIYGFHDGFRDYLEFGGPCRPPASPPPKYRIPQYLSPEGHCAVRDYFLGFQYGVDCAIATGMRQYYTLPILVTDASPPPPLNIVVLPSPPDESNKKETAPPPKADVPMPKAEPPNTVLPKTEPMKPVTPAPMPMTPPTPMPMTEPPKADPKPPTPVPMTPVTPMPKAEPPKSDAPKSVPVPGLDPKSPIPPVEVPKIDPPPKPPTSSVPTVPAGNPPPIPLVPMLPTVTLSPMSAPIVVPALHTETRN